MLAIRAWNLLSNGHGGLDWAGLPVVCEHLGIDDPTSLIDRLQVIKTHRPDSAQPQGAAGGVDMTMSE